MCLKRITSPDYSKFYENLAAFTKGYRRIRCHRGLLEYLVHQNNLLSRLLMVRLSPAGEIAMSTPSYQDSSIETSQRMKNLVKKHKYATLRFLLAKIKEEGLEEEFLKSSLIGLERISN